MLEHFSERGKLLLRCMDALWDEGDEHFGGCTRFIMACLGEELKGVGKGGI